MSPHLDKELCEKYTNIMVERHLGAMQTSMCWGFDHGDGWFHILDSAMRLVQSHIDMERRRGKEIDQVVFEQVKEKFGMLTIYHRGGNAYTDGILRMAEEVSRYTCEECGAPGTPTKSGWIRTLCDKHHEEMGK
jgi:hypothetical protein